MKKLLAIAAALALAFSLVGAAPANTVRPPKTVSPSACTLSVGAAQIQFSASAGHYFQQESFIALPSQGDSNIGNIESTPLGCTGSGTGLAYGGQVNILTLSDHAFPGPYGDLISIGYGQQQGGLCAVNSERPGSSGWPQHPVSFFYSLYGLDGSSATPKCFPMDPYGWNTVDPGPFLETVANACHPGSPDPNGAFWGDDLWEMGIFGNLANHYIWFAIENRCSGAWMAYQSPYIAQTDFKYFFVQGKQFNTGCLETCGPNTNPPGTQLGPLGQLHSYYSQQNNQSSPGLIPYSTIATITGTVAGNVTYNQGWLGYTDSTKSNGVWTPGGY